MCLVTMGPRAWRWGQTKLKRQDVHVPSIKKKIIIAFLFLFLLDNLLLGLSSFIQNKYANEMDRCE